MTIISPISTLNTASTTAQTIINGALRLLQVASTDVVITSDEANDALEALNQMIDGWSNESLMLYHVQLEQFTCTPGLNPHTIGYGGNFNTSVPIHIESSTVTVGGVDYPIIQIDYDDYAVIKLKTLQNVYPEYMYFDRNTPILGNLYMYPVPSTASIINLYSRKQLTTFASLTDSISLPVGYARALKYSLAVELAPEYQVSAGADVIQLAISAKANLKRTNRRPLTLQIDPAALAVSGKRRFNIYTGQ
jgi:hypothetical protein